ncbi:MAG: hypothetical protein AB2L12_17545 [Smithellaceae bacterium]
MIFDDPQDLLKAWQKRKDEDARDDVEKQAGAAGVKFYGNDDKKVSPYLKAWIAQPDEKNTLSSCVIGLIGQGTSRSLQANWNSPFEQSSLGGMFEKVGGALQAATNETSVTTFSSTQIWEGNKPHTFNLTLSFYAINNALKEVMEPLRELEKMMGPNISAGKESDGPVMQFLASAKPGGRIPLPVIINIGRRMMIPNCVIESMSTPLDGERTKEGYLVRADATLSISTKVMLNRENIAATWR